jgi:hypothetical protein
MTWIHNPFFHVKPDKQQQQLPDEVPTGATASTSEDAMARPSNGDDEPVENVESTPLRRVLSVPIQSPTERLTGYQFFYIFILDGLGAFALSGGINFAIAYGKCWFE